MKTKKRIRLETIFGEAEIEINGELKIGQNLGFNREIIEINGNEITTIIKTSVNGNKIYMEDKYRKEGNKLVPEEGYFIDKEYYGELKKSLEGSLK